MCELDVFVGNFAIIDWELYSLWLSGRSVSEAVAVFVRENRTLISDFHASQDMIVSDFNDNWRLFSTLENSMLSSSTSYDQSAPVQLLDTATKKRVIESYHSLDSIFCREILGRKLNSKLRKDLDEVYEKTGVMVRSCRRQFDNIKKIQKALEETSPKVYVNSIVSTFGLSRSLAEKYAALVFAASFRLELSRKKLAYLSFDRIKNGILTLIHDWGDKDEALEPTLDREFLASLKDIKVLLEREKEHRHEVLVKLKANMANLTPKLLNDIEANFKNITRSIVSFALAISSSKEIRELFIHLVEKPVEAFKAVGASEAVVDLFLKAYGDVIKENTLKVENDVKVMSAKYLKTLKPIILAVY